MALASLSSQDTGEQQYSTGSIIKLDICLTPCGVRCAKIFSLEERNPAPAEWGEAFWTWLESRSKVFVAPLEDRSVPKGISHIKSDILSFSERVYSVISAADEILVTTARGMLGPRQTWSSARRSDLRHNWMFGANDLSACSG